MEKVPKVVYILEKHKVGESGWQPCLGAFGLIGYDQKTAADIAKTFTEESSGWKFRARKYVEA